MEKKESKRTDLLIALKNIKPPPNKRLTSLRRLIILEQHARPVRLPDRVRRGREQTRRCEIWLGFVFGRGGGGGGWRMRVGRGRGVRTGAARGGGAPPPWRASALVVAAVTVFVPPVSRSVTVGSITVFALPRAVIAFIVAFVASARVSAVSANATLIPSPSFLLLTTIVPGPVFSPMPIIVSIIPPSSSAIVVIVVGGGGVLVVVVVGIASPCVPF